jgi:hypothetical protein
MVKYGGTCVNATSSNATALACLRCDLHACAVTCTPCRKLFFNTSTGHIPMILVMFVRVRLATLCGLIVIGLSLVYLFLFGSPITPPKFDSVSKWHTAATSSQSAATNAHDYLHLDTYGHTSPESPTTASPNVDAHHLLEPLGTQALNPPSEHGSRLADVAQSACSKNRPNLILSALSGELLQDQIFIFLQSLDTALAQELLATQRAKGCPPSPVEVHILVPKNFMEQIPPSFKKLMERYPSLELVPALPEVARVKIVLSRFKGWAEYLNPISAQYDRILAIDLDVVFQRNPFAMPLKPNIELLFFAEWRGLKIGQCPAHQSWFDGCAASGAIGHDIYSTYMHLDRICAGSIYGTARAMQVYLDTMTEQLAGSGWGCNDQAMHIHLYYTGRLADKLRWKGIGKVDLVPNESALLGTVGTTPLVRFNEWGEVLNEQGEVQHVIHQFKKHVRLTQIIRGRYGWLAPVGNQDAIPPVSKLVEQASVAPSTSWGDQVPTTSEAKNPKELKRYLLSNVTRDTCNQDGSLCSCKFSDCQFNYDSFLRA